MLRSLSQRQLIRVGVISILVLSIVWWRYSTLFPSTDNAYVEANVANIAAQVTGPVQHLYVQNHQAVKAGQLLFTIDPKPFQVALDSATANYTLAEQQVAAASAAVENAEQVVTQRAQASLTARQDGVRTLLLAAKGVLPKQAADDATGRIQELKAVESGALAQLKQARANLGSTGSANATLQQAKSAVEQARLALQYSQVTSPATGVVENLSLRVGDVVNLGVAVFSVVDMSQWWIDANFKETQLERIKPGQKVNVRLDMYSHHAFSGVVDSISESSGAIFSLLPPENATGNWVKVTQRFPVRIRIGDDDPDYPLRVGASASVSVNTV